LSNLINTYFYKFKDNDEGKKAYMLERTNSLTFTSPWAAPYLPRSAGECSAEQEHGKRKVGSFRIKRSVFFNARILAMCKMQ